MSVQTCSTISLQAGESLVASAPQAEVFFLLEYNGAWGAKVIDESTIPAAVKAGLSAAADGLPAAKILLIKHSLAGRQKCLSFFVVIASETAPTCYEFQLDAYEDLLEIDLPAVLGRNPAYQSRRRNEPLFLVCTNGRRDACCARHGVPVVQALQKAGLGDVWECSHLGGHRFAANVYQMPAGILYGRIQPEQAAALSTAVLEKQVLLENLRGRGCYTPAVQAGEYFLRKQSGCLELDAFRLEKAEEIEPGNWQITFVSIRDGEQHSIEISMEKTDTPVFESCSLDKQTRLTRYRQTG
jgi:hypothetical protein